MPSAESVAEGRVPAGSSAYAVPGGVTAVAVRASAVGTVLPTYGTE